MAKRSASGNKSQAIRDALAANPDKGPKEIADDLQAQGYKVNAQYVSTVKFGLAKKAGGGRVVVRKKLGRPPGGTRVPAVAGSGMSTMDAALALITSAGGLEQAKATLATIEQIRAAF
jgi:hypothetical protein